jgi:hypothetical protein
LGARENFLTGNQERNEIHEEGILNSERPGFQSFHVFHRLHVFLLKHSGQNEECDGSFGKLRTVCDCRYRIHRPRQEFAIASHRTVT